MEVPPGDDTMEMASPYQGNMDDFEIDLDVMEDQASDVDNDLDVADASPEPTHGPESIHGSTNDADMVDEIAERAMVDADEHQQGTHDRNESDYYQNEETYEAQMLEDEYEEDIDAPVPAPDTQDEIIATDPQLDQHDVHETSEFPKQQRPDEQEQEQEDGELHADDEDHFREDNVEPHRVQELPDEQKKVDGHDAEEVVKESGNDGYEDEQQLNQEDDTNDAARVELQHPPSLNGVDDEHLEGNKGSETFQPSETQPSADHDGEQVEAKYTDETVNQEAEVAHEVSHLHPVKVLYQDSEISLFPPQEGDPSETFFLEDESLAHRDLGKLLVCCRQVLGEHVSEGEVLVVDIHSLNLQLNEDSSQISNVTLSQIVDLYLQLCRNDGVDEPEPLYLTLSTKLTLPAEISNLLAAAGEGKGLSHIHPWDEYENGEQEAADVPEYEEEEKQEDQDNPHLKEQAPPLGEYENDQQAEQEHVEREATPEEAPSKDPTTSDIHDTARVDETESKPRDADDTGSAYGDSREATSAVPDSQDDRHQDGTYVKSRPSNEGPNEEESESAGAGSQSGPYDFEEQTTDSSATLAHTDVIQSAEELKLDQVAEESVDQNSDYSGDLDEEGQVSRGQDFVREDEEVNDEHQQYNNGAEYDGPESGHDGSDEVPSPSQVEPSPADQNRTGDSDEAHLVPGQSVEIHVEEVQEPANQTPSPGKHVHSPSYFQHGDEETELAEDLLGIDEDLFKSPAKNPKGSSSLAGQENAEHMSHADGFSDVDEEALSGPGSADDCEELPFDEDYIDLGTTEASALDDAEANIGESGLHENTSSGKRSRGPEDEVDLAETPSPDAKRRRSS